MFKKEFIATALWVVSLYLLTLVAMGLTWSVMSGLGF